MPKLLPLPFAEERIERGFKAWLGTRTIPQEQKYAYGVLERAGVNSKDTFSQIELGFGLSLTDAYWVAPQGLSWNWVYVNLYESSIQDNLSISIYDPKHKIEVPTGLIGGGEDADRYFNISPAYGVGGTFKKAWYKQGDVYILRKSGSERCSANTGQEPWSEFVAAQVAEAMGIEHVDYSWNTIRANLSVPTRSAAVTTSRASLGSSLPRQHKVSANTRVGGALVRRPSFFGAIPAPCLNRRVR